MPAKKRKAEEIAVDSEGDADKPTNDNQGKEQESDTPRGRRGRKSTRGGRGRSRRAKSTSTAPTVKEEEAEEENLLSRRSTRSISIKTREKDNQDNDTASGEARQDKAAAGNEEDDDDDEHLTIRVSRTFSLSKNDSTAASGKGGQTEGKAPDAPQLVKDEQPIKQEQGADVAMQELHVTEPALEPSAGPGATDNDPSPADQPPSQSPAEEAKEKIKTEVENGDKETGGPAGTSEVKDEAEEEVIVSKRGVGRGKRKAHVIDDAHTEDAVDGAQETGVAAEGDWQPEPGTELERSLSVESDALDSKKPSKSTKAKSSGKAPATAGSKASKPARGRGGRGGRGGQRGQPRRSTSKKVAAQQAAAEEKLPETEKLPTLRLIAKQETTGTGADDSAEIIEVSPDPPADTQDVSPVGIIPESLEPSQAQLPGRPPAPPDQAVQQTQHMSSASGNRPTPQENAQERADQIQANLKICLDVFAEASSRARGALDQIAADVDYLDSLKITEAVLSQTGVGKIVRQLSKPNSLQLKLGYEKKAGALIERWRKIFERQPVAAPSKGPGPAAGGVQKLPGPAASATQNPTAQNPKPAPGRPAPPLKASAVGEPLKPLGSLAAPTKPPGGSIKPAKPAQPGPKRASFELGGISSTEPSIDYQNAASQAEDAGLAIREQARLILEELFKPPDFAFLPSEAASAAEAELYTSFKEPNSSAGLLYVERLKQVSSLLHPSSPQYLPQLLATTMRGKIHPADVVSLDSEDLETLVRQAGI